MGSDTQSKTSAAQPASNSMRSLGDLKKNQYVSLYD